MHKRIIIAGGGTGGHIFPAIAVANALKAIEPSMHILFVGAKGKMEMEKVPKAGYEIRGLDIAGFDRGQLLKNITLPFKLINSFWQVRSIFKQFKPHAAFGVGGYSSFPVLRYAQVKNIPTYLHEANAFGGKSNIFLSKRARIVFTGTLGMERFFPAEKILFTGNPVRKEVVLSSKSKKEALQVFGLEPGKTTLFVVGGSLGARSINHAIRKGLSRWMGQGYQLIWQTGKLFIDEARKSVADCKGVFVSDFVWDMNAAYTAADLVISRSGAMSVTELCLTAKPVIFVPFPFAAEDHQTANAKALADKGAALIIQDSEVLENLVSTAIELAADDSARQAMTRQIKPLAKDDADTVIANEIIKDLG
jgi:UDP-N-acetylglucosamine--N-acetylmuramyl-(pentapeptide) pyrophosphoryl-undecaprenol N-acetylglucosamine transferase